MNPDIMKDYYSAQITTINYPNISMKTEDGASLTISATKQQKQDPLFWESLKNIWLAGIWLPVSKAHHQLYANDWLVDMPV